MLQCNYISGVEIKMLCYHTCKTDGGRKYVHSIAPFLSEKNTPKKWQWLTQGYYFWTDSPYYAHIWGQDSYKGDYAIVECEISIDKCLLLDLVGNTKDCEYFNKLLAAYQKKLESTGSKQVATVSGVIEHFRQAASKSDGKIFPYQAIKAFDIPNKRYSCGRIKFTETSNETMVIIPRLQLCLFESAKDLIGDKNIVHFS